jgi:hypothetical protein
MTSRLLAGAVFFAVAGVLLTVPAHAASNTTYSFLRDDVSARAAALAGSFVSVTNDPNMLFYNVAGLGTLDVPRGSVGFFKHLLDINSGYVSYSQKIEGIGHVGAGITYTNYGSFTETDEAGNDLGSFGASDLSFAVGYANELEQNLTYGASVKVIYSAIAGVSSTALAADAGILYVIPESKITLGASIRNLGSQLSPYLSTRENLPLDVTIGGSIVPRGLPLLLNVNLHRLNDDVSTFIDRFKNFSIGGEFTLSKVVQLRFGYDNARRKDLKLGTSSGMAGFSAGLGINTGDYRIDYAISSLGKVGNFHRISIGSTF